MANTSRTTSPYITTQVKDWYLDLWDYRAVPKSDYDEIKMIPPAYDQRPDLMSHAEYGTSRLWWVFAVRNPDLINDPIADFQAGLEIFIPANILK